MHGKVGILDNIATYLESFFMEKKELITALRDKLSVIKKQLTISTMTTNNMMTGSKNLNEIPNHIKTFGEKKNH